MESRAYWVGFNLVKGIGAVRLQGLLRFFGDLETAWNASPGQLAQAGLSLKIIENLAAVRKQVDLAAYLEKLERHHIQALTWDDDAYPARLKEIAQPPPVLYCRGALSASDDLAVAIVGTRRVTTYGRQVTEELAAALAAHGVTVVSGLARGVDGVAHQAALKAGGRTLAVLGSGVDRIYPPEHTNLAERISAQGAVLSDYAPGTPPDAINFPPRNRIVSGLTSAVIVVEAGETSGALITAAFAADQGRDVYAVPGSIYSPASKGTNKLLLQGARPILGAQDLLEALALEQAPQQQAARMELPIDPVEATVLQSLSREPQHIDDICARSGLPIDQVSATLVLLELKGYVQNAGAMQYAAREPQTAYRISETHD